MFFLQAAISIKQMFGYETPSEPQTGLKICVQNLSQFFSAGLQLQEAAN